MKLLKSIRTACLTAVLITPAIGVAALDFNPHEKTFLTFSQPVELPNLMLPAGEYLMRLADTPSRNVVQVWNRDQSRLLGQWLFVPMQRLEVTSEPVIMFREIAEGATPAVQAWFYPGREIGREFIYPKDQALRITQRTGARVRTEG